MTAEWVYWPLYEIADSPEPLFDADGNHLHLWQWEEGPGHGYDPMGEPPSPPADTTCYWCGRMYGDC